MSLQRSRQETSLAFKHLDLQPPPPAELVIHILTLVVVVLNPVTRTRISPPIIPIFPPIHAIFRPVDHSRSAGTQNGCGSNSQAQLNKVLMTHRVLGLKVAKLIRFERHPPIRQFHRAVFTIRPLPCQHLFTALFLLLHPLCKQRHHQRRRDGISGDCRQRLAAILKMAPGQQQRQSHMPVHIAHRQRRISR